MIGGVSDTYRNIHKQGKNTYVFQLIALLKATLLPPSSWLCFHSRLLVCLSQQDLQKL